MLTQVTTCSFPAYALHPLCLRALRQEAQYLFLAGDVQCNHQPDLIGRLLRLLLLQREQFYEQCQALVELKVLRKLHGCAVAQFDLNFERQTDPVCRAAF